MGFKGDILLTLFLQIATKKTLTSADYGIQQLIREQTTLDHTEGTSNLSSNQHP